MNSARSSITPLLWTMSATFGAAATCPAEEPAYALFELGHLSATEPATTTWAIDASGASVGGSRDGQPFVPYRRSADGAMTELPTLGGLYGEAYGMNDSGVVVGWTVLEGTDNDPPRATMWIEGKPIDLVPREDRYSEAWDVNESGTVVGRSAYSADVSTQPVVWISGIMSDLLAGQDRTRFTSGVAQAINEIGWIVGQVKDHGDGRAVLWRDGEMIDLGDFGGDGGFAYDVNDIGLVVGLASTRRADEPATFIWENGILHQIDGGAGGGSYAAMVPWAINNVGEIVGRTINVDTLNKFAQYWSLETGLRFLGKLQPPRTGLRLENASDINDAGQIVGWGFRGRFTDTTSFLMSPVHPTMTVGIVGGPLLAGADNTLRLTGAEPGAVVHLAWSLHGGGAEIPGGALLDNALQLRDPKTFATLTADGDGRAEFTGLVPLDARGRTLLIQAVSPERCAISELLVAEVE